MCELCLHFPCLSGCPNSTEPPAVFICSGCGKEIYDGEDYWDMAGEQFCEACVDDARRVATYDPD